MERVGNIIDRIGGNAFVARELGIKPSAVSEMKRRNSIPPRYWARLIKLAHAEGHDAVTADLLVAVHADTTCIVEGAAA